MGRILALSVLIGGILVATAAADTVYMRNGKKLVGKVTEKDGKYIVKMSRGTVAVDKSKVICVAYDTSATKPAHTPTRPADPPAADKHVGISIRPPQRWNANEATLPEPLVFMTARQLELLGEAGTKTIRQQLRQWRIAAHEGKRKCGKHWLSRDRQRQQRTAFEKHLRNAKDSARKARSVNTRTGADRAKKRKLLSESEREYYEAAKALPDTLMCNFLTAMLDLHYKKYKQAEHRFRRCIQAELLIAAFHQGRGIALMKMKQPLRALAEFTTCLELRDDSYEPIWLIEAAMKEVPGAKLGDPVYLKAKDLLGRYEKPRDTFRRRNNGVVWLMPGGDWRTRSDERFTLPVPPYDRIISKQALAVPIGADGVLLVDSGAIAGADLLYVQIAPNVLVRAKPIRHSRAGRSNSPLAAILAEGVTFTPVNVERPAVLKPDQTVIIRAVNLYRQMGTGIRIGEAKVISAVQATQPASEQAARQGSRQAVRLHSRQAGVTLSRSLLPGEGMGVVLAGKAFVGLLTARTDPAAKDCGKSTFIKPADLAARVKAIRRSLRRISTYNYSRGPKIKEDAPKRTATGQVFLVHILLGEKPPPQAGN